MLVNNFNCFYNKQVKKDNPHFGALKIDREVVSNVDFLKKNENLKYVTEIAEELKNTKFYDLHVKYTGDRTWHCGIIDKQARQDIHKSIDKDIYAPFRRYETGYLTQNKNFIVLNYVGEHHNSIPSWWSTYFEVGTEEEAEKLIYDFKIANRARLASESGKVPKLDINAYVKYLKVLEAVKANSYKRKEVPPDVTEYINKNLKDCIIDDDWETGWQQ